MLSTLAPGPTETVAPTLSPVPIATRAFTRTPRLSPTPTLMPSRTPTRAPSDLVIGDDLNAEEQRMIQDGINLLKACASPLYDHVRAYVTEVHRGNALRGATGYVRTGSSIVYLPESGSINDPIHYRDSMRTFVAAALLVHEARHIQVGATTTEPDAYSYELQVFTPACKPNDIGDDWNTQYEQLKHYVNWRASLPYPDEPPRNITPPPLRPTK